MAQISGTVQPASASLVRGAAQIAETHAIDAGRLAGLGEHVDEPGIALAALLPSLALRGQADGLVFDLQRRHLGGLAAGKLGV
jgi:hypothetical protein